MKTRQMTPFFHLLFLLFVTFIFIFENGQNSFSCDSPFGLFWSVKYLNYGKSYRFGQSITLFQKVDTLRLLKIHIIVCPRKGAKKGIRSWTNTNVQKCLYQCLSPTRNCITDFTSAKMEYVQAILKKLYFSKY